MSNPSFTFSEFPGDFFAFCVKYLRGQGKKGTIESEKFPMLFLLFCEGGGQPMNSLFCCPVCGGVLDVAAQSYFCVQGHSFDRSAKGYVNLLLSNQKNSREPGDDADCLRARRRFLNHGFYAPLARAISQAALDYTVFEPRVLDCCCGEGYYTNILLDTLRDHGKCPQGAGFDISKTGVKMAASRTNPTEFAVASVFHIPSPDSTFDLALLCFAPYCDSELTRVLKPGGILIRVIPGETHLYGLKQVLYDRPYKNDEESEAPSVLEKLEVRRVADTIRLTSDQAIDLLSMTPYAYRTDPRAILRLHDLAELKTDIEFLIEIFRKPL